MKNFRLSPTSVTLAALAACNIILNIVGIFLLPPEIKTQISFGGGSVEPMSKALYLFFSATIIVICSVAGLYLKEKRLRYLIVDVILTVANTAVFVINLI